MDERTRRSWIVTISQAAVGLGVAGKFEIEGQQTFQLPPGLYGPSSGHLGHALMSAEPFHPIPAGCPTDYIRPRNGPFTPLFFSHGAFAAIRRLVQLMLGETSTTDGGSAIQEVAEWIDLQISCAAEVRAAALSLNGLPRNLATAYYGLNRIQELEKSDPGTLCREGLLWISKTARQNHGNEFLALATEQQIAILDAMSDGRAEKEAQNAGTRFFAFLKGETIRGFYTSQVGLKELDFKGNAFYARSPGCDSKKT